MVFHHVFEIKASKFSKRFEAPKVIGGDTLDCVTWFGICTYLEQVLLNWMKSKTSMVPEIVFEILNNGKIEH